jgi:hypothetical protein
VYVILCDNSYYFNLAVLENFATKTKNTRTIPFKGYNTQITKIANGAHYNIYLSLILHKITVIKEIHNYIYI